MKSKLILLSVFFLLAVPMFGQTPGGTSSMLSSPAAAIIGMAIASGLCGLAQGKAVAGATEAMARNPGASAGIRFALILGLVLIESLALYTLVMSFTFGGK